MPTSADDSQGNQCSLEISTERPGRIWILVHSYSLGMMILRKSALERIGKNKARIKQAIERKDKNKASHRKETKPLNISSDLFQSLNEIVMIKLGPGYALP